MVDQRKLKSTLEQYPGQFFSASQLADIHQENIRSIYSKLLGMKSDPDIIVQTLAVGGKTGSVTMYAYHDTSEFTETTKEYRGARQSTEGRQMHTETVENILVISKLNEIIRILKGVIEKWK